MVLFLAYCQSLGGPQRLAAGSRPAALLCLSLPCCVLSLGCFSFSLSHVQYLQLLPDGELFVWIANIWLLTSWWEGVQRRVLHKLLLLPMQGGEIGQLVAVFWLRKVMILISANFSRKCGAYSSQQPGRGRWVWKAELRGDSNSNTDWCVLAVVKHAVGGGGGHGKS